MRIWIFGFRGSGCGFLVLGFGFRVSGIVFFWFRVPGFGFQVSGFGFGGPGSWVPGFRFWVLANAYATASVSFLNAQGSRATPVQSWDATGDVSVRTQDATCDMPVF